MKKNKLEPFKVGVIVNPFKADSYKKNLCLKKISILYPSRLNAMALDPGKVVVRSDRQYSPGEVVFKIKMYKKITVEKIKYTSEIKISKESKRKSLIMHSALLMKKALRFNEGLLIRVENKNEIKHAGLGSSSGLIASVACAINEIYGNSIEKNDLLQYLAQNHGEEIGKSKKMLSPVQCIGGSAAAGLYEGGLLVLAGKSRVIASMKIDLNHRAVIGIPRDFREDDGETMLKKESEVFDKVIECSKKFAPLIAYRFLHEVLPSLQEGRLDILGDLIFDYRYKMGSINYCSYAYHDLVSVANRLIHLKEEGTADVLSLSSVGPGFFVITKNYKKCREVFENVGFKTYVVDIENETYKILEKE